MDAEWVGFLITGGWLVLIPAVLIGLLLGDEAPWRRVGPENMLPLKKVELQVKLLNKRLAIFFLFPSEKFLPFIIQYSVVGNFSPTTEGTKTNAARCLYPLSAVLSLPVHFESFVIVSYCFRFVKFVCLLKRLQRLKQKCKKSPAWTRQTYGKLGFVLRKRKKISQITKTTFTYRYSS